MTVKWKKLREKANQITGFQIPIIGAGLSWEPKELDISKANKLFVYLDDKRVLYYDPEWEFMPHVIESVANIRQYIVEKILMETDSDSPLYESCKELRDASVEFLDLTEKLERREGGMPEWKETNYRLMRMVLGRLRRRFGKELAKLAILYKVDVEDNLATILPVSPSFDEQLLNETWQSNS
ncbi:MAG: hypothetical protein RIC84_25205 [Aggregatilineales bacterium]